MTKNLSLSDLVSLLKSVVDSHNSSELTQEPQRVRWETVEAKLSEGGFTSLDAIAEIKFEDLAGIPVGVARALVKKVREVSGTAQPSGVRGLTPIQAQRASNAELIAAFNPSDGSPNIRRELLQRLRDFQVSPDSPFIVVGEGGEIVPSATLAVFEELIRGEDPRETFQVGNDELDVLRISEVGQMIVDVHPLFPSRNLRGDGTDSRGLNWMKVSESARQFLFLGASHKLDGLGAVSEAQVIDVYERALGENSIATLKLRYPGTWKLYRERRQVGDLPKMKTLARRNRSKHSGGGGGSVMNLARP